MAVTVEIKDQSKAKGDKKAATPQNEAIASALLPQEKQMGQIALGVWLGVLVIICGVWNLSEATKPFAIGMPLWCLASIAATLGFAPNLLLGALKKDPKAKISSQNQPALKAVLSKVSPILGIDEPTAYLDNTSSEPALRVYNKTLVFNAALQKFADQNEISALAVRGLAHERLGHSRRLGLLDLMSNLPSPIVKLLIWPVWIYARLLEQLWLPHAMQNADRVALMVIRNHPLLLSAILKQKAASDENMKRLEVTSKDVADWVAQKGHIGMAGEEISTQYKLGRAIHEDLPFEERLQNLQTWGNGAAFKEAVEKLASGTRR